MKYLAGFLAATLMLAPRTETVVEYEVIVMPAGPSPWELAQQIETPIADSLVDWEEHDRQTDCLWLFLQEHFGYDLTLDRVLAAGYWTETLGGACLVIGEDNE